LAKSSKNKPSTVTGEKVVSENRRARYDYHILDTLECGIVLTGSEVKSLRNGRVSITDSYAKVKNGELWLVGCDIPEYLEANRFNHKPKRDRKLLLHKREMRRFAEKALEKGFTLVPLKLYFNRGRAKILVGLCRGKQEFDKRESKKKSDTEKGLRMSMMKRR
jgi:SsrA-binding protein